MRNLVHLAAVLALSTAAFAKEKKIKTDTGVDLKTKTVSFGALNDESGPAASIGKPYALGKRILVKQINAGGSGLLPDGWKIDLVERDHGYNPQNSVQAFNDVKDKVLALAHSFGTPNTLPLRPMLAETGIVAFPASLSSEMASHENTPPLGPSYMMEAMRALDFAVEHAGGADKVKAGIVYQQDDYGKDGIEGLKKAAEKHGVKIVSEQTVAPGQKDVTAVITALKGAGANYVILTTLPSATGPILGTAMQLQFTPVWLGNTPSWIDKFFVPAVIPSAVFAKFYWVTGLPYWGENLPGMDKFLAAYEKFGKDASAPDFYILVSYVQGLAAVEAFKRALDGGDATRAGFKKSLRQMKDWNAGGLIQPVDFGKFPYMTSTRTRVLKPNFEKKSWDVAADWADPKAMAPPMGKK